MFFLTPFQSGVYPVGVAKDGFSVTEIIDYNSMDIVKIFLVIINSRCPTSILNFSQIEIQVCK